ncbi:MAG: Lrp/AsnC family transcriptional regulator [Candidatus Bathyarchaeota archaeon]|nr:Lrp/AsnC family transcriptional regulator [Candidatus Bathyarchaeota archaeon]
MQRAKKLDALDAKILHILLKDSRTSFTKMAQECKISVVAVKRRYERMKKAGVIKGELMLVNPYSLGYKCTVDLGIVTSVENEKEVIDFLRSKPFISGANGNFGRYNIQAFLVLQDIEKLTGILGEIESHPKVVRIDSLIWAESVNMDHTENLEIPPLKQTQRDYRPLAVNRKEEELDEIDRRIAAILSMNSRMPFRKVAKQVGISTRSVIQRFNELKKSVLTKSTLCIDLNKLGYNAMAHIFIKVSNRSQMQEIYNQIFQIPNLIIAIKLIGPYDVRALVALKNFEELFEVTERFRQIKGIDKADTYIYRAFCFWPMNLFAPLLWTHDQYIHPFSKGAPC